MVGNSSLLGTPGWDDYVKRSHSDYSKKRESLARKNYPLRRAVPSDSKELAALARRSFQGYPFEGIYDPEKVRSGLEEGEYRLVAENRHGDLVGTAVLGIEPGNPMCEIKKVMVDIDYRVFGIGNLLVKTLVGDAYKNSCFPWLDARANTKGIQLASLNAGLTPICFEPGKHIVYSHLGCIWHKNGDFEDVDHGAEREAMVHFTGLPLNIKKDLRTISKYILKWPSYLRDELSDNLLNWSIPALPSETDYQISRALLPGPKQTAKKIEDFIINESNIEVKCVNDDVLRIEYNDGIMAVIKPDASAFIHNNPTKETLDLCKRIGLQAATYYEDISKTNQMQYLSDIGMDPIMLRPWKESKSKPVKWQVGWRKNMNGYEKCLHRKHDPIDPYKSGAMMKGIYEYLGEKRIPTGIIDRLRRDYLHP
jgi:hypothetical protein